jgi:two-component system CitB family response regulator/two-component system response regulator DcuR
MDVVRVLIVEDDERIAEIHRRFTEKVGGFEVVGFAKSILEGKEMCDILDPDLILLDLYFPDGYGIDLLRQVRSRHQEVDLILITAAKEVSPLKDAIRGGVFDYIIKPVVFSRFRESMEKYLEYRRRIELGDTLEQKEVDRLLGPSSTSPRHKNDLPKGIDPLTLQKIRGIFDNIPVDGLSAEETGSFIGVSRTTARRYLEYLVSGGYLTADLVYRKVGRPERKYFRVSSI